MTFAVLPVKAPANAKQRLAGLLPASARELLARVLFEQMLAVLRSVKAFSPIAVATSDERIARRAAAAGALVFEEDEQLSHSHSADRAARLAAELGAATVALLPIDLPLVRAEEIEELVAGAPRPGVAIVPSEDGTGTNALVRTPPDAIASRFGPGSFRAHFDQARARGLTVEIVRPPGLTFDVDTPEDVAELLRRAPECRIARLLRNACASKS